MSKAPLSRLAAFGAALLLLSGCARMSLFAGLLGRSFGTLARPMDRLPARIEQPVRPEARLAALWVGHATVLMQIDDKCSS